MRTTRRPSARAERPRTPASGFTLIETVIAGLIFTIGALALALVIPLGVHKISSAGRQTNAGELASDRSEFLLNLPQSDTLMAAGTFDDPSNPYPGQLYASWTIEDGAPLAGCKRITISVRRGSTTSTVLAKTILVSSAAGSGS